MVSEAIAALKPFYPTRAQARELLKTYRHREALTASDVRKILAAFPVKP